jgi:cell division protein FtsB
MSKKILYSKPSVFFLLLILIFAVIALGRESYRYFKINQEIKNLEQRIENIEKSNEELSEIREYYQSEEFLEKEARLKLNLTKPGEKLIIIKQIEEDLEERIGEKEVIAKEISNIQKWWNYFFGEKL